jgi:hypothetical protein
MMQRIDAQNLDAFTHASMDHIKVQARTDAGAARKRADAAARDQQIEAHALRIWQADPRAKRASVATEIYDIACDEGWNPIPAVSTIERKLRGIRAKAHR